MGGSTNQHHECSECGGHVGFSAGGDLLYLPRDAVIKLYKLEDGTAFGPCVARRCADGIAAMVAYHLPGETSPGGMWSCRVLCFPSEVLGDEWLDFWESGEETTTMAEAVAEFGELARPFRN